MSADLTTWLDVARLIAELLVVPGIGLLWRISEKVHGIEVALYKDFVRWEQIRERLRRQDDD